MIEIANMKNIDIIILQETSVKREVRISGWHCFVLPKKDNTRGCITMVRQAIPCSRIENPANCGEEVEVLAVEIKLQQETFSIYNIYKRPQSGKLDMGEVCSLASQEQMIIGGDFNAHHPCLFSNKTNESGTHIATILESYPEIGLLNTGVSTHNRGGRLDLTMATATLMPRLEWQVEQTVILSDHFGIITTIREVKHAEIAPHCPKWNTKKADWKLFTKLMEEWATTYVPISMDVDALEADFVAALNAAANLSIPRTIPFTSCFRDWWYFTDEVKEANHRANASNKAYQRHKTPENKRILWSALNERNRTHKRVRTEKFQEFCARFSRFTRVTEIWNKLNIATRKSKPRNTHHAPLEEANKLALHFAKRTSSESLPRYVMLRQHRLRTGRIESTRDRKMVQDCTDLEFSDQELWNSRKTSSDTAPGSDLITHSMISHLGPEGRKAFLRVINESWRCGRLPNAWKKADITPIPKPEKGAYRPISLLSCLSKTVERMVLRRLTWKLGPLHENIHGFTAGKGTTHSVATLLSHVGNEKSVVVFLDLEKAFELASPYAILETLEKKGVRGRLLAWIENYLQDRSARVRFQGHLSEYQNLENGTPQGGVLSPTLFNILMSNLVEIPMKYGCTLISYADDLALVAKGTGRMRKAQYTLDKIDDECCKLGLKISAPKSKVMEINTPGFAATNLHIQGIQLEQVREYKYLGIWIDNRLTFKKEVKHLKETTALRLSAMRCLTGKVQGASHRVLRMFYIQAIRPIVDYAASVLFYISKSLQLQLETIQNSAARIILGAPTWARASNLCREANLMPLYLRVRLMAANSISRLVQSPSNTVLQDRIVKNQKYTNHEIVRPRSWTAHAGALLEEFGLKTPLLEKGMDSYHPDFIQPPPWEPPLAKISIMETSGPKKTYDPIVLKQMALETIQSITPSESITYFTDGSVDQHSHTAGSAFVVNRENLKVRTSDTSSTLQTEAVAIQEALNHALIQHNSHVVIHTDSLAAINILSQDVPRDNINLITSIIVLLRRLKAQNREVILNWVPSHIDIIGNERADREAESARKRPTVDVVVQPSRKQLALRTAALAREKAREFHAAECVAHDSALWYKMATEDEPWVCSRDMDRDVEVTLHRLRLGYKCRWERLPNTTEEERSCKLCNEPDTSLLHYLTECERTTFLRTGPPSTPPGLVRRLCNTLSQGKLHWLATHKPPR